MGLLAPTAATATVRISPVKLPTMATSEALNSCSRMPVAATGNAYRMSLFQMEPCSISILRFFVCPLIVSPRFLFFVSSIVFVSVDVRLHFDFIYTNV